MKKCELCKTSGGDIVFQDFLWRVVEVDDANYPGFFRVIWNKHVAELSDLAQDELEEIMEIVCMVERALRKVMRPDKINLASLGNMVPHLHWHVIPRFVDDVHFPQPIWGQPQREPNPEKLAERQRQASLVRHELITEIGKRPFVRI